MSDRKQIAADVDKMKSSPSQPSAVAAPTTTKVTAPVPTADDAFTSHTRLSRIFAPLMETVANNEQVVDYDTTTLKSLPSSTMSSSSSSNQVSHAHVRLPKSFVQYTIYYKRYTYLSTSVS